MKKTVSAILVCLLIVGSLFALVSCSKTLSGTYKGEIDFTGVYTEAEFTGKVVKFKSGITSVIGNLASITEATYEIVTNEDQTMSITFTYAEGQTPHSVFNGTKTFAEGVENGVSYIKIGGVRLDRQ